MIKWYIAYIYIVPLCLTSNLMFVSNKTSVAKYRSISESDVFSNKTSVAKYRSISESDRI